MKKVLGGIGGIIAIVFGFALLILCIFGYFRGISTETWVSTDGTVISVELDRKFLKKGSKGNKVPQYNAIVKYAYEVSGQEYVSDRHSISSTGFTGYISGSKHYLDEILKIDST